VVVLVADDFDDTRQVLRLLLEMKGHSVVEAADGKEAVEGAIIHHPDLILMDLSMPVMDGFDATRSIREQAEMAQTPIVALTAHSDHRLWRERALKSGCDECYSKPLDFDDLDSLLSFGPSETRQPH
jgi:CheY-like chemotaxis protein